MKKEQLAARLMSMESGISSSQTLYTPLDDWQFEKQDKSIKWVYNSSILFDDRSTSNIDTIINSIRAMVSKYQIDGVVIDYLQILSVNMKGSNKEQQMADVARRLKNLANMDHCIIPAQQRCSKPSSFINRLRDSGQIAEAADVVMFVYRTEIYVRSFPEPYKNKETEGYAMIDVAKGRNMVNQIINKCESNETHIMQLYESKKGQYWELDFFVLQMIKLNITSTTSPYRHKYKS